MTDGVQRLGPQAGYPSGVQAPALLVAFAAIERTVGLATGVWALHEPE